MRLFIKNAGRCLVPGVVVAVFMILAWTSAARGSSFSFSYDDAGRLLSAESADGPRISLTYDANGNLLSRVIATEGDPPSPTPPAAATGGGRSSCFVESAGSLSGNR